MDIVGGYNLVRRLGVGSRSEVWLGHAAREPERTVAVKIFRAQVSSAEITSQMDALVRVDAPHLLRLLDVTMVQGRPALILQRMEPRGLLRRMGAARPLSAGEAVTVLAPLADAIATLHLSGVSHGAVGVGSVLFDDSGAPVLASFGSARVFADRPSPARIDSEPSVDADREAFRAMTITLLRSVGGPRAALLGEWVEQAEPALSGLAERLFELAPGEAIDLDGAMEGVVGHEPSAWSELRVAAVQRPTAVQRQHVAEEQVAEARVAAEDSVAGRALGLPEWIERAVAGSPLARLRERALPVLAKVRRPVWVAGGAGLAALVLAITLLAPGSSSGSAAPPSAQSSPPLRAIEGPEELPAALSAADPVAAAEALITRREECFEQLSSDCIDRVDQPGSAGWEADRAMVADLRAGEGEAPAAAHGPATLVQTLGDTAILTIDQGASIVLLVRSDGRWWLRDLMTG